MAEIWLCEGDLITKNNIIPTLKDKEVKKHITEKEFNAYKFFTSKSIVPIRLESYLPDYDVYQIEEILKLKINLEEKMKKIREINKDYIRFLYYILNSIKIQKEVIYYTSEVYRLKKELEDNYIDSSACNQILLQESYARNNSKILNLSKSLVSQIDNKK